MSTSRPDPVGLLPPWLVRAAGVALAGHLLAVAALALAAPSGPWPTPFGRDTAAGPAFAEAVSEVTTGRYLAPLKLSHNYHFAGNRPGLPGVYFEVRLKDAAGKPLRPVRIPDPGANFWVRHRQALLAQALADDRPLSPPGGEVVAAPRQRMRTVPIWDRDADGTLRLRRVAEHLIPRDRTVYRPSEWSLVLANSYVRHLCRRHGASSGELIRHTREPILPAVLFLDEVPAGTFEGLISNFGEVSCE